MPETTTTPTEDAVPSPRVSAIEIGAFVEVATNCGPVADNVYAGTLAAADERGIIIAPSDKQLAAYPDIITPDSVIFFPWSNIAFISVAREH